MVTGVRWASVGLLIPLFVLYPLHAGLSLIDVGVLFAVQTGCVVLFELPTGGLADSWGRRRAMLLAATVGVLALGLLTAADSMLLFVLAFAVNGVFWALDSGPLEAWYVDIALELQPGRDLTRDLSLAGTMLYGGIAVGCLGTSVLTVVHLPVDALTAAVGLALGLQVLHLVAVAVLVREAPRQHGGGAGPRPTVRATIGSALRSGWRRPLRWVLAVQISWGAALSVMELLWQPLTARQAGPGHDWVFGMMGAVGWAVGAGGSALLPWLVRLTGGRVSVAAAVLRVAQGAALLPMALAGGLGWIMVGYVAVYLTGGPSNAAHSTLLHRYAESRQRATVLSLDSFVQRISGGLASLGAGVLATAAGAPVALAVAAVVMAAAAPLYLVSGEPPAAATTDPAAVTTAQDSAVGAMEATDGAGVAEAR